MTRTKCSTFHNYKDVLACNLVSWFSVRLLDMEDQKHLKSTLSEF